MTTGIRIYPSDPAAWHGVGRDLASREDPADYVRRLRVDRILCLSDLT